MAHESTYKPNSDVEKFLDDRLPLPRMASDFLAMPTPRNLNYFYTFGGILTFCLLVQIMTGIVLAMHYKPSATEAFASVEHIMRNVNWGWLLRYTHAVGASMFFIAVYIHIARGLWYGSYKAPREILWILGVLIFLLMMATAFMGYALVWGQMSFWGITVITNLFSSLDALIPGLGTSIVQWIWGDFAVSDATLNRMFALHYLLPFAIAGTVGLHIWALHVTGSNNPQGVEPRKATDTLPFHPYFTVKDLFALALFCLFFAYVVFQAPNYLGHADNYIEANPLSTPAHIVPEWYFLPFYAILRAVTFDFLFIPAKLGGVIAMFGSIAILFFIPWLDRSRVRSAKHRPIYKWFLVFLFISVCALGYLGAKPAEGIYVVLSQVFTFYYFAHFLIVMPFIGIIERPGELPRSITEAVLGGGGAPIGAAAAPEKR
ncbi:MAG: cytochrome b/b6 [Pseudomonadota bacterium]